MTQWRLQINNSEFAENLYDVEVTDALNRFGRNAIAYLDDSGGEQFEKFPRGTRLDFEYTTDSVGDPLTVEANTTETIATDTTVGSPLTVEGDLTVESTLTVESLEFEERFSGYVVERKESNRAGADSLEVEAYSFDHFLRRNKNQRDLSGKTISQAIQELIEDFTPVTYDGTLVNVSNDQTLNRGFRGERIDTVLDSLANKSASEEFGVNNDIRFFFRPRDVNKAPRQIDNTQWTDYDLPELGKRTVNEVKVFYNDGQDSVIVDDSTDKEDLQNTLNTPNPVTLQTEAQYNDITSQSAAKDKAEEILNEKATTLSGTVTTFGLLDARPGDVIDITIIERGLDSEFRIAAIEYRWGSDETILTIQENRGANDDKLISMVDRLDRVELRTANRDAVSTRFIEVNPTIVDYDVTVDVVIRSSSDARFQPGFGFDAPGFGREPLGFGNEPDTFISEQLTRVTNPHMNSVRDGWAGDSPPTIDTVALGSGDSNPSRSDTELDNQVASASVANVLNRGLNGVRFSGEITFGTETTIREAGLEAGTTLHSRSTIQETTINPNVPIDVIYNLNPNLDTSSTGVITTTGETVISDIIANDNPDTPSAYLFGSDDTDATQSDTSLGNELLSTAIDRFETGVPSVVSAFGQIGSTELVGVTIAEMGLENSAGNLLTRLTFADTVKESGQVIEGRTQLDFNNE